MLPNVTRVRQFQSTPEAEAKGQIMQAWLTNQLTNHTRPRLEAHGIGDIEPEGWYPYQTFLDIMSEVVQSREDVTSVLVAVGKAVVANLPLSDFLDMASFQGFIESLYGFSVRNTPDYERNFFIEHEGAYYIFNNTPVSNDILYGFLWELLRRYRIAGSKYIPIPCQDYPSELGSVFQLKPL